MQKKLLTNGNVFKRTDGRWNGVVWYLDEQGERKRKSFCGTSKPEVKAKITEYIADFKHQIAVSDESKQLLRDSLSYWLRVFKFPSVERTTYDRLEWTATHLVYPLLGDKVVGDVTSADIKTTLNHWMSQGFAYTTVKKVHNLLTDYFRYLTQQELVTKNPMPAVPMIKRANFLAAQGKENLPTFETVTTFSPSEIERFKAEAVRKWNNGKPIYQQSAAYVLMLNTGLRTCEVLGLLNSDIDLNRRVIHLQRGVKEIAKRNGVEAAGGMEMKVGKLKTASSKRDVPLNQAAVDAILDLRAERYFGENAPLIPDEQGGYTKPVNFRKRYYRNHWMAQGFAYTTVKKVHNLLTDYFRYLTQQELVSKNPMPAAPMIKRANFLAAQGKENLPTFETVTTFSPSEIKKFKAEAVRRWSNGKPIYQQSAAYVLMLNTGLRTCEVLGLLNSDIDLDRRVIHLQRGVKEIAKRNGVEAAGGMEMKVGKLKTASSKRDVPLNQAAVNAILELRAERYFGEDSPLIADENGNYTKPVNFRKRYYRILEAAGIEQKGLHSLRHTFATNLVNGVKQPDGTIKALSPRQVADLLGHSTSEITELYYVKRDTSRLAGITAGFEL